MTLGVDIRMKRLFNDTSGKILAVTFDHVIGHGVLPGLSDIDSALRRVMEGRPDAVTLHKGIAQACFAPHSGAASLIVKCSSFAPFHPTYDTQVAWVEEAVRLGADAVAYGLILGDSRQHKAVREFARFVRRADDAGLPVVGHIYPRGDCVPAEERRSVKNLSYAVRVGAELGASVIKTNYPGNAEEFHQIIAACPARVVAAGGLDVSTPEEFLQQTEQVMSAGAAGVVYGRFVWSFSHPAALVRALGMIIHEKKNALEAGVSLRAAVASAAEGSASKEGSPTGLVAGDDA